jgi:hypothetical protein
MRVLLAFQFDSHFRKQFLIALSAVLWQINTFAGQIRIGDNTAGLASNEYGAVVSVGNFGLSIIGGGTLPTTPGPDLNFGASSTYALSILANWYYYSTTYDMYSRNVGETGMLLHTQTLAGFSPGDIFDLFTVNPIAEDAMVVGMGAVTPRKIASH